MSVLTSPTTMLLWHDIVKHAEDQCSITLNEELEVYLVTLLIRYSSKPEIAQQIFATKVLQALHLSEAERQVSLQYVGDQCLLFAGLFPRIAERRHVKINYFVNLGRGAYAAVSKKTDDLYGCLALQFVTLMDVLQSIRPYSDLMPMEAYERWSELGSLNALRVLKMQIKGLPIKNIKD